MHWSSDGPWGGLARRGSQTTAKLAVRSLPCSARRYASDLPAQCPGRCLSQRLDEAAHALRRALAGFKGFTTFFVVARAVEAVLRVGKHHGDGRPEFMRGVTGEAGLPGGGGGQSWFLTCVPQLVARFEAHHAAHGCKAKIKGR